MFRTHRTIAAIAVALLLALTAAACSSGSSTSDSASPSETTGADQTEARLRVAHIFSSDAAPKPTVDIYASTGTIDPSSDQPAVKNLEYGTITDYLTVPADTYNIGVYVAGGDTEVKTLKGVDLKDGSQTTAIAERASTSSQDFSVKMIDENALDIPKSGDAAVTAYHGVPLDAANGVRIGAEGAGCLADGAQLNYQQMATIQVPAGSYKVGVFGPDDTSCSGTALIGPASLDLDADTSYLAIAYGTSPSDLNLLPAAIG